MLLFRRLSTPDFSIFPFFFGLQQKKNFLQISTEKRTECLFRAQLKDLMILINELYIYNVNWLMFSLFFCFINIIQISYPSKIINNISWI